MRRAPKTPRGAGLRKDIGEGRQGSSEDREPADEGHFPGGFEKQTLTWLNGRDAPHHQEHVYTEGGGLSEQRPASRAPASTPLRAPHQKLRRAASRKGTHGPDVTQTAPSRAEQARNPNAQLPRPPSVAPGGEKAPLCQGRRSETVSRNPKCPEAAAAGIGGDGLQFIFWEKVTLF